MKCAMLMWLYALPTFGLKVGGGLVLNQSIQGFPTCQGNLISKTYGIEDGHCGSKSSLRSPAAESACRQSYDVDAAGEMWQCQVKDDDSDTSKFKCISGMLCQEDIDPFAVWDQLASVGADVEPEMSFTALSGMTIYGGGKNNALTKLTNTKWLACGEVPAHCVAVEMVSGGFLVGDKIDFSDSYWQNQATWIRENKAVMCGGAAGYKYIGCELITADSRVLTKQASIQVQASDSTIKTYTQNPSMVTLEDGKIFMCFMERFADSSSNLVCTFLTEKDGTLKSESKFVMEDKLHWAGQSAAMGMLAKGKVLMCLHTGPKDKRMIAKVLTIDGTSVSSGPVLELPYHSGLGGLYKVAVMNSLEALYCDPVKHQCSLISVSGDKLTLSDPLQMDNYGWPYASIATLWSDRVMYCAGSKKDNRPANPWCTTVTCKDKKCTKGKASHPNDADDKNPQCYRPAVRTLVPGKVVVCTEDNDNDIAQGKPFCAVYALPSS